MNIGGHGLRDHIRLLAPLFGLITVVWLLRFTMDSVGISHGIVRFFSVTGAGALAVLLAALLIHLRRFGGYPNVVVAGFLLVALEQLLIVSAIVFSVVSGVENIFTTPEFSIPGDSKYHLRHILGHLTFGLGGGTLFSAAMGCLVLWVLRMLLPTNPQNEESQSGQETAVRNQL